MRRSFARECAAHGYVGVIAYARGKGQSSAEIVPFEHDGEDVRAVIDWIAQQPWSDGKVGMYGSGYASFTAWAAAEAPPVSAEGHRDVGPDRARHRRSDGRQHSA